MCEAYPLRAASDLFRLKNPQTHTDTHTKGDGGYGSLWCHSSAPQVRTPARTSRYARHVCRTRISAASRSTSASPVSSIGADRRNPQNHNNNSSNNNSVTSRPCCCCAADRPGKGGREWGGRLRWRWGRAGSVPETR